MSNNRFGKPAPAVDVVVDDRFSKKKEERIKPIVQEVSKPKKKAKVATKQKAFRLPLSMVDDLEFICFVTGRTEQKIGEKAISTELSKILKSIKNEHGEEGYQKLRNLYKLRG